MVPIVVAPAARRDIRDAVLWYEGERAGLGGEFAAAVRDALLRVADGPEQFAVIFGDLRRAQLDRFPYAITFRLARGKARVAACTHHRRHPSRWRGRR